MTRPLRLAFALLSLFVALGACSGDADGGLGAGGAVMPGPQVPVSRGGDAGAPNGPNAPANGDGDGGVADGGPTTDAGRGSGGSGGPAPGEHDVILAGTKVALHVPPEATSGSPVPLLLLLHGQGDTGRNFLNVWLAKGLPKDLILAAPDDNSDDTAAALETALRGMFDIDLRRQYVLGFSQGGAYAAFLLFDATRANRFAAVALASSGLAESPSGIPAATPSSPAVAVVIDPTDPNNTWNQGLSVMEDFVTLMSQKGYGTSLVLHDEGHKLAAAATQSTLAWMLSQTKP